MNNLNVATLVKQLNEQVENELIIAQDGLPIRALAERVITANRELVEELMQEWRITYVSRVIRAKQAQIAREQRTAQMMLPGYERLPARITLPEGGRKPLETATYWQLQQYLIVLRRRQENNARLAQVKSLIELMDKWRKKIKNSRGLTVAEVMQREAGVL